MRQGLFRQVALDKLASPEQLDQLITVTTPRAWLALVAMGGILLTAVFWGIWGSIPTKVYGMGVITKSYGVYNIAPSSSGQITDIRVVVGDPVKKGDVVARIEQPQLVKEINYYQTQLGHLEDMTMNRVDTGDGDKVTMGSELAELYNLTINIRQARADLPYAEINYQNALSGKEHEIKNAEVRLEQAKIREAGQQDYVDKLTMLFDNGAIAENDFTNAKRELELMQLQTRTARADLAKLTAGDWEETIINYKARWQQAQLQLQMLEEQFNTAKQVKIAETKQRIKDLQYQLGQNSTVVSQVDGRILEIRVGKGDLVQPGQPLFSLEREGRTITTEVVMYVQADEGKQILPGMEAMIAPSTVKREEHGQILGRVVSVSEYPATGQGMLHTLGNENLVQTLAARGAALEMHIDLIVDEATVSGFQWTSPNGPPLKINSGTLCSGAVTVRQQRPISMVIPALKKKLAL